MPPVDAILAGDVGGTNTRLALYAPEATEPLLLRVYPSAQFESLEPIVSMFLGEAKQALPGTVVRRAGFGVAGPTDGAVVQFTNLPWLLRADKIASACGLERVLFLNDFVAICRAVPSLGAKDLAQFGGGKSLSDEPRAVLGAGTGLGVGYVVPCGTGHRAVASGGGHIDFAPRGEQQTRLAQFLATKRDGSYLENLLSGRGLETLYVFLRDAEGLPESAAMRQAMTQEAPAAVVTRFGQSGDPLCERALRLFCELYGAVAATLAVTVLAGGGVYIAGGIAAHIRPLLEGDSFRVAFEQNIRYAEFLRAVPRYLITHPQPGLLGAAIAARDV